LCWSAMGKSNGNERLLLKIGHGNGLAHHVVAGMRGRG